MREHPELHVGFGGEGMHEAGTLDSYLGKMATNEEWACGPIIDATALRFAVRINIVDFRDNTSHLVSVNERATDKPLLTLAREGEEIQSQHYSALLQRTLGAAPTAHRLNRSAFSPG